MRFYHAPLGADASVFKLREGDRPIGVVTSGFVAGSLGEAIEEVADAAERCDMTVFHLGPRDVVGMRPRRELSWWPEMGISDRRLAEVYSQARWVSGLRYVEGFELPAVEGLLCGARPIMFDRPDARRWFDGHAEFVREESGPALVSALCSLFERGPRAVSPEEREELARRFDWRALAGGFWEKVIGGLS